MPYVRVRARARARARERSSFQNAFNWPSRRASASTAALRRCEIKKRFLQNNRVFTYRLIRHTPDCEIECMRGMFGHGLKIADQFL